MHQPLAAASVGRRSASRPAPGPVGWAPLLLLPVAVWLIADRAAPWILMWGLAGAIFAGFKWLTWWQARGTVGSTASRRSLAYLFLWPGMDARAFLDRRRRAAPPPAREIVAAACSMAFGAMSFWGALRLVGSINPLLAGWIALVGLI